jgi:SpoVK/Ycf46/Vps4 family AAA+-type ATPase
MSSHQTKVIKITRHVKRRISNSFGIGTPRDIEIVLANIEAEVIVDESGEWKSEPKLLNEQQVFERIIEPISKAIASVPANLETSSTRYIIDFDYEGLSRREKKNDRARNSSQTSYITEPRFPLSRVVLPEKTKQKIQTALSLVKNRRLLYDTWNLSSVEGSAKHSVSINLYGPSGTGKTLCAEAIAYELGQPFLAVQYSQLESSLVGETNKNIQSVFRLANASNCVLFFDEADSILGRRLTQISQSADHGINMARSVMLIELEKFDGVVVFSTNLLKSYDKAFARRLLHFVQFDMPDHQARQTLFQVHIPKELPLESIVSLDTLAALTDGFSGGDIRNVVLKSAALAAIQNVPDNDKILTMQYFIDSINEISASKAAMASVTPKKEPGIMNGPIN